MGDTSSPRDHTACVRIALVFLLALVACEKKLGPEETLNRFLADLRFGRSEQVWASLSQGARTQLEQRHAERRKVAGLPEQKPDPAKILFADLGLNLLSPPESVAVAGPISDTVRLRVTVEQGNSADIYMVQEGGAWKVDLAKSLKASP